ncbi:DUF3304 domain-containing protein [Stenotrophomonas sp. HMWF003]|uniref:DUF3304 domain-containing protein n=1 Tax=Stenotrophomonas sp. HMWF003 TaxID=2056840 RepID=UPI000FE1AD91|nr:DUF3304 domain-containing protein [Stenotrophomonas sp. HMWF003]
MSELSWLPEKAKVIFGMQGVSRTLDARSLTTPGSAHCMRTEPADSSACALMKPRSPHRRGAMHIAALAAVVLTLTSCKPPERSSDPNARVGGSLTSMDYEPTDTYVDVVYVNGRGGDIAGTGGSTVLGAISLPQRWHPGLTVRAKWRRCRAFYVDRPETEEEACRWIEKYVPVHPYTYVGRTWLHIFADDEVLVIPSMKGPNHPDYPGAEFPYKNFNDRRGIGRDD